MAATGVVYVSLRWDANFIVHLVRFPELHLISYPYALFFMFFPHSLCPIKVSLMSGCGADIFMATWKGLFLFVSPSFSVRCLCMLFFSSFFSLASHIRLIMQFSCYFRRAFPLNSFLFADQSYSISNCFIFISARQFISCVLHSVFGLIGNCTERSKRERYTCCQAVLICTYNLSARKKGSVSFLCVSICCQYKQELSGNCVTKR